MISIRRAVPEDAQQLTLIAFAAKAHWGYPDRWMEIWRPQLSFGPDYFEANESWVADMDSQPVAFCTLLEKEGSAWIENLWVRPAFIGKGVGKELFRHARGLARERGFNVLRLEADPNAVGFYERMGMRRIGERHSEIEGQPRLLPIMKMDL